MRVTIEGYCRDEGLIIEVETDAELALKALEEQAPEVLKERDDDNYEKGYEKGYEDAREILGE